MTKPRLGVVGGIPFMETLESAFEVARFPSEGAEHIVEAAVDGWVVSAGVVGVEVLDAIDQHVAPTVFLASGKDVLERCRRIRAGHNDVARMPATGEEVLERLRALKDASSGWSTMASRLCTTAVHDLRSPLQGMRFTLSTLAREGVFQGDLAEDLEMLEAVADTLEVQLHGLYNLGRRLADGGGVVVDLAELIREDMGRPFFTGRVQMAADGPLWVRGHASDLHHAVLDVLRVMALLVPGSRPIHVRGQTASGSRGTTVEIEGTVYAAALEHRQALLSRGLPALLRGTARLPFAGLAFAADAVAAAGGTLSVQPGGEGCMKVVLAFPSTEIDV